MSSQFRTSAITRSQRPCSPLRWRRRCRPAGLATGAIDSAVSELLRAGGSTYTIDILLLRRLQPDLLLTQALCDVCAVSEGQVHRTVHEEELGAQVLTPTPLDLDGVFGSIEKVGEAIGHVAAGHELVADLRRRLEALRARTTSSHPPLVLALEWIDPPFVVGIGCPSRSKQRVESTCWGGHGSGPSAASESRSRRLSRRWWSYCHAASRWTRWPSRRVALWEIYAWRELPAARRGAVWTVDAAAWFSRSGPRVVEGAEALAAILADPLADEGPAGTRRLQRSRA